MAHHYQISIPGAPKADKRIEVRAPYDGALIATIDGAGEAQIEKALSNADSLFQNQDAWIPLPRRIEILESLKILMEPRLEALALEAAREGGKPLLDSRIEAARALDGIKIGIETLRTDQGRVIPMNLNAASAGRLALTQREPIGPVVAISAFNHPLNLIVHQVVPAVAAGCPVIVKPATVTPLSCWNFVQLLYEAGLPEEWCQMLVLSDTPLAERLAVDPRVAFLSFIGSARVGWSLRQKLAPGTRCSLEHGGVAPVLISQEADFKAAAAPVAKGGFYHAGQVCVSVQRVYVEEAVVQDFAQVLAKEAARLIIGDPTSPKTEVGPLIRHSEVDRVEEWVQEAVKAAAQCLTGGKRISKSCYSCTVLLNPPDSVRVSREEIFGPVIAVYGIKDWEEGIRRANSLPFAFQAAVFTSDMKKALHTASRLKASAVMINDHTAFRVDWMPFAGLKQSGLGIGGIPYSLHDMQVEKMVVIKG